MLLYIVTIILLGAVIGVLICKFSSKLETYNGEEKREKILRNRRRDEEKKLKNQRLLRKRLREEELNYLIS